MIPKQDFLLRLCEVLPSIRVIIEMTKDNGNKNVILDINKAEQLVKDITTLLAEYNILRDAFNGKKTTS